MSVQMAFKPFHAPLFFGCGIKGSDHLVTMLELFATIRYDLYDGWHKSQIIGTGNQATFKLFHNSVSRQLA